VFHSQHSLLFNERVRPLNGEHAFRPQLLGSDVDVHLIHPRCR
jgi:hypothetical protein